MSKDMGQSFTVRRGVFLFLPLCSFPPDKHPSVGPMCCLFPPDPQAHLPPRLGRSLSNELSAG